jgi:hypothetical protein
VGYSYPDLPQMAWSQVRETVAEVLSPSDGLILFCGMRLWGVPILFFALAKSPSEIFAQPTKSSPSSDTFRRDILFSKDGTVGKVHLVRAFLF